MLQFAERSLQGKSPIEVDLSIPFWKFPKSQATLIYDPRLPTRTWQPSLKHGAHNMISLEVDMKTTPQLLNGRDCNIIDLDHHHTAEFLGN